MQAARWELEPAFSAERLSAADIDTRVIRQSPEP
jgi:hypothetical protein